MGKRISMLAVLLSVAAMAMCGSFAEAQAMKSLKLGSTSTAALDLQFRLQLLNYFSGPVTGSFGAETEHAVKGFQNAHGLADDGIAGPATWAALKKVSVSKSELAMLARVIYGEARGEDYKGQVAVGSVVMNRLKSPAFPQTIKEVIMERGAFTAVSDGQYWLIPDKTAFKAAKEAVTGSDPTKNALYYYNPDTATSKWIFTRKVMLTIGNHSFAV
ncbi:cell wall hydrolase [Paenibacillus nasutitermitis]|uniref:Spore cortex-lytic enzyme n=1 Tax=Paenibacillus nasutitermitis TaxID=1652958 RepID=A0A916YY50_9BACL|nr:cell wall hydrolase [Paenibacillus nasutitermitis]GGD67149.1 spore cortex-lytic enzyme [Paenibacillus nasutitermitis]